MVTSNSFPCWKGKFLSLTSSCHFPSLQEFRTVVCWSWK
uniref:Uncharacterized protein n=1 Tax=Anguilla anguilla TaxID=7936 RepID=A0A0E9XC13_ANGAN